ncbi:Uridylate kinase [uncultured archaeon]|nr:Uridylate kinase [uncultured archaeon]
MDTSNSYPAPAVVLSVGGSLLNDGKPNAEMAAKLAGVMKQAGLPLAAVCGGGKQARKRAESARKKTGSEFMADMAGIKITHKNAEALRSALGPEAGAKIFKDFKPAQKAVGKQKYIVMGGTIPGITTDADSALLAEALGAKRLVNLSNTAIYDSDPRENPNAKKFDVMSYSELIALANKSDQRKAGTHFVFDMLACSLIARSRIETHFVDGRDLGQVRAAIMGEKHSGTIVRE